MSYDNSMTKIEPRINNSNVPECDILIDEVLINAAATKIGVEDAASISIKILLSWTYPDGKLFWFLNVDVFIQDIGDMTTFARVASSELHVDSLPGVMHEAVPEGNVVDIVGTNGPNGQTNSTGSNSFK